LCGNTAGYVGWFENLGLPAGAATPRWSRPRRLQAGDSVLRIQAGPNGSIQGPCEAKWGYTTLSVADWDHDGMPDIICNSIWGKIVWYRNVGGAGKPQLAAAQDVAVAWPGPPPKPSWTWWTPGPQQLATQWRTTPVARDLNGDGLIDLTCLDHEGYLAAFLRRQDGRLDPPRRLSDHQGQPLRLNSGRAGRSGRRKIWLSDWDRDGRLDLLVNAANAALWRNVAQQPGEFRFQNTGLMDQRVLSSHTTSPTVCDWDGDGRPALLIGAEDGRLYYKPFAATGTQTKP
jgi:hypothetical protein